MNYNWYESQVDTTISTMQSIGRSEFDAFAGLNVQENCMDVNFRDYLLVDEDGVTRLSLALYCPNSTLGLATSGEDFHEVEQRFYTNAVGDPRDTSVDVTDTSEKRLGWYVPVLYPTRPQSWAHPSLRISTPAMAGATM